MEIWIAIPVAVFAVAFAVGVIVNRISALAPADLADLPDARKAGG